jgi:DnaJ-class molecular chaperone
VIDNHPGFMQGFDVEIPQGTQNDEVLTLKGKGMTVRGKQEFGDVLVTIKVTASLKEKEVLEKNKIILESLFS